MFFDVSDSLLLASLLCGLENRSFVVGYGHNLGVLNEIRSEKNVKLAEKVGQDIIDFGVSPNAENAQQFLFTNQDEGCNPPKRKRNSAEGLLPKRILAATVESRKFKVPNMKDINAGKREYSVSSIVNSRKSHTVQICSSPSFSCPDF